VSNRAHSASSHARCVRLPRQLSADGATAPGGRGTGTLASFTRGTIVWPTTSAGGRAGGRRRRAPRSSARPPGGGHRTRSRSLPVPCPFPARSPRRLRQSQAHPRAVLRQRAPGEVSSSSQRMSAVPRGRGAHVGMALVDGQMVGDLRHRVDRRTVRFEVGSFRDPDASELDALHEVVVRPAGSQRSPCPRARTQPTSGVGPRTPVTVVPSGRAPATVHPTRSTCPSSLRSTRPVSR
jgi:hypothetical protein